MTDRRRNVTTALAGAAMGLALILIAIPVAAQSQSPAESTAASHNDLGESSADGKNPGQKEVERVLNAGLPFAERWLDQKGEFAPFGAVMLKKGLIQTLTPDSGEHETSQDMLQSLVKGIRSGIQKGEYRAIGVFAMVEMKDPVRDGTISAVHVGLESRDGYCVDVYYPVVLRGDGLVLDDPMAGKRSGVFFNTCQ